MDRKPSSDVLIASSLDEFGTRVLTLNRPDKANALNPELAHALLAAVRSSAADGCRALVLTGAAKHFCGGFDFTGYEEATPGEIIGRFVQIEQALQHLRSATFVSFALVHGTAFGAGADLAAACTYRIGGPRSRFRFPGFQFGVALGTRHLARLIGTQQARDVLLRNRVLGAEEALALGLLTHLAQDDGMQAVVKEIAAETRSLDRGAIDRIHNLTADYDHARDLAELVESLSAPGLHERIAVYRETRPQPPSAQGSSQNTRGGVR